MRAVALSAVALVSVCFAQSPVTVVNYAGFTGNFPVAPGSIASAYGPFANVPTAAADSLNPLPTELGGTRLRVNDNDAPLYFVFKLSDQLRRASGNAHRTGDGGSSFRRQRDRPRHGSEMGSRPGFGIQRYFATPPGDHTNQDFGINSENFRARREEVIQIYATGCGAVNPAVQSALPPTGLSRTVAGVNVYFGAEQAAVQFAGAHPLFPGICQINAAVPDLPYIAGQVPLYFTAGGVASNRSVWVQ